jgi:hypothetical protein
MSREQSLAAKPVEFRQLQRRVSIYKGDAVIRFIEDDPDRARCTFFHRKSFRQLFVAERRRILFRDAERRLHQNDRHERE